MEQIYKNVYYVGDSGCSIYLVDSESVDGLILIDCGMSLNLIKAIGNNGINPLEIQHCIITHFHIDHIAACYDLNIYNKNIKFYAHELDSIPIEESGHDKETAASWYGIRYKPIKLYRKIKGEKEILKFGNYALECIHTPGHTPGSISVLLETSGKKVLFGQDIHGPFMKEFGSNLNDYQKSMQKLLNLEVDILCEGHFGIIQPAEQVSKFIKGYMRENR
jgi:glyoxylase-like metal-dependent hydrolase (beta-lactamase superfamily II)